MSGISHETIGTIGAILTTTAFLPQTVKVIRTRDTQSISLTMYLLFTTGVCFWLVYGLMIESVPVVSANLITLVFSSIILLLKLKERPQLDLSVSAKDQTD
jgi:MtN3 and saliva related transmembrane protein